MAKYEEQRRFLKSNFNEFKNIKTDKMKGMPQPPAVKSFDLSSNIIKLPDVSEKVVGNSSIYECIKKRRSTRFYADEPMSLEELSYLLWATQGVTETNKAVLIFYLKGFCLFQIVLTTFL